MQLAKEWGKRESEIKRGLNNSKSYIESRSLEKLGKETEREVIKLS